MAEQRKKMKFVWITKKRSHLVFLILILLLAIILRVLSLDKVPPELFGDELDVGYHAYSLLTTTRDYYGQFLPVYIHSFSEWRAPLLMYATVPFVGIFGLNEWGIRLPSAAFGILTILLFYFLVNRTLKDKKIALLSTFFLAISPWHLQYSRAAFEVSLLLFLLVGGILSFWNGMKKPRWFYLSAVCFSLTFYTYSTANLFTPLLLITLIALNLKEVRSCKHKDLFLSIVLFVVLCIPIIYNILFGPAANRYRSVSIFTNEEISRQINEKRANTTNVLMGKFFYNKPIFIARKFLTNYTQAFSPQFLFIDGDITFRQSIHEIGEFYWIQLPLILLGLFFLMKQANKMAKFWLLWLIISPIPAALTWDGFWHATRLILMLPPLIVIAATGVFAFLKFDWGRKIKLIFLVIGVLIMVGEFTLYINRYWRDYPRESWRWWQYGYKQAIMFMKSQGTKYKIIAFNNTYEPSLIRFLVWWHYPPKEFLENFTIDQLQKNILPKFDGFSLEKRYYFGSFNQKDSNFSDFIKPDTLYLASARDDADGTDWSKKSPPGIKVLKTVRNFWGDPVFFVVTGE